MDLREPTPPAPDRLASRLLASVAEVWPKPTAGREKRFGAKIGTAAYRSAYARDQYMRKVWFGFGMGAHVPPMWGKSVLEVGCGHGGISIYLASLGARSVVGVDLNEENLQAAVEFRDEIAGQQDAALPVEFLVGDIMDLPVRPHTIDYVVADNLLEHVTDPERFLRQAHDVLAPGGRVLIPIFSSIKSKYGLHLKIGLGMPWANLVFSEGTIVEAVQIRARRHPELVEAYPGVERNPERVRDLRRHGDLNDITYGAFREMIGRAGFELEHFHTQPTLTGKLVKRALPQLEKTPLFDVLSTGASAVLRPTA